MHAAGGLVIAATRLRGGSAALGPRRCLDDHRSGRGPPGRQGAPACWWCGWTRRSTGSPACSAARQAGARFSVTVRTDPKLRTAIAAIPDDAWTPIRYPRAIWDDQLGRWISDAQVAETEYTAFASRREQQAITARLIVRRVKDLSPRGQGELFTAWRYHAVFTDSPFTMLQAEEHHRGHAQAEQVFADWTDGPLAHLPSGSFPANAAWLALAAISCNLLRAARCLASLTYARARGATLRRDLIDVAARTARHARGDLTLHLPQGWHCEQEWASFVPRRDRTARCPGLTRPDRSRTPQPATGTQTPATQEPRTSRRPASGGQTTPAIGPEISSRASDQKPRTPNSHGGSRLSERLDKSCWPGLGWWSGGASLGSAVRRGLDHLRRHIAHRAAEQIRGLLQLVLAFLVRFPSPQQLLAPPQAE